MHEYKADGEKIREEILKTSKGVFRYGNQGKYHNYPMYEIRDDDQKRLCLITIYPITADSGHTCMVFREGDITRLFQCPPEKTEMCGFLRKTNIKEVNGL